MNKTALVSATVLAVALGSALPAAAQKATTAVLEGETLTGVPQFNMPTPPVGPLKFTLPIETEVVTDASVTTRTPITDQAGTDLPRWAELIRGCLKEKPALVRTVEEESVPFIVGGSEGRIKLNQGGFPVCPL